MEGTAALQSSSFLTVCSTVRTRSLAQILNLNYLSLTQLFSLWNLGTSSAEVLAGICALLVTVAVVKSGHQRLPED